MGLIDWMHFCVLYVLLSIVLRKLKDGAAKKALMDLRNGCALALQWSIEARNLRKIKL
jgi:hypothetical protein